MLAWASTGPSSSTWWPWVEARTRCSRSPGWNTHSDGGDHLAEQDRRVGSGPAQVRVVIDEALSRSARST